MSTTLLRPIANAEFRANPRYELIPYAHLPAHQQALIGSLREDPAFYGILRPRVPSALTIKSVCDSTAALYTALTTPGPIPQLTLAEFDDIDIQSVASLVLDDILEIAWDGTFVSGPTAHDALYEDGHVLDTPQNRIATLSLEALRYGAALAIDHIMPLSFKMYGYNRIPDAPHWAALFPTPDHVAAYLGIRTGDAVAAQMHKYWVKTPNEGWHAWSARRHRATPDNSAWTYKLYISPVPRDLPMAFQVSVRVLWETGAAAFKVGRDRAGILRSDKLVAYFDTVEAVQTAALRLNSELAGIGVQGVPFTADLTGTGLLSWGMDPPRNSGNVAWLVRESWRLWVTNRLATALVMAQQTPNTPVTPWQFALERLQIEHIDIATWTPLPRFSTQMA